MVPLTPLPLGTTSKAYVTTAKVNGVTFVNVKDLVKLTAHYPDIKLLDVINLMRQAVKK